MVSCFRQDWSVCNFKYAIFWIDIAVLCAVDNSDMLFVISESMGMMGV